MSTSRIYLDNASTTPIRNEVIKVMMNTLQYTFGNPSSIQHSYGRASKSLIEESRIHIAKFINAKSPNEIIFTSGGTESNSLVFNIAISHLDIQHIITSKLEHVSVLNTVYNYNHKKMICLHFIHFNEKGVHDLNHMEKILKNISSNKKNILVSLMYINNEIGNILEIKDVILLCKKYNAYYHSDTMQYIGIFRINVQNILFDFATASAHKFYGPKGIGFVFIRNEILRKIKNFVIGKGQENGIRLGTENIVGIVGLSEALKIANYNDNINKIIQIKELKSYAISLLKKNIPGIIFNGLSYDLQRSTHFILNFLFPMENEDHLLYFYLDLMGIAVSKGSACNKITENSHVIKSITSNLSILKNMMPIRISFSIFNKKKDIDLLINSLNLIKKNNISNFI